MKLKKGYRKMKTIKDVGKGDKFELDNPRKGGGASWGISRRV